MEIFPAIDLRDGQAVRLFQGDYDQMTVYSKNPADVARQFKAKGARNLHLVDLDGAKDGRLVNFESIREIIADVDLFVEVGGGIRDEERIRQYLDLGVGRVILGTIAVKDPAFLEEMVRKYGEKIAVGVDVKDGLVAINGWKEVTDKDGMEFCQYLRDIGVKTVIYTDISRDGGLKGTNLEAYKKLARIKGLNVVASGGISFAEEITALKETVYGAILGKALYDGLLDLETAVKLAE
ncbi:1-(5-phosphoribosyl)-5-[(5-phosphoribosylamino)methylideneamino]imidazole-4-carboxamide isomerase [Anaerovorax odorimutans]|uniref:1-(5-phosphoribosyl)-5-[(5-phosphoribosylamino)methylideneamino] imidazole-4-carboxamide isomerase n=1 Tax=Anaerovorax odorimutans TaxID=109327 RepID=A0ABT1RT77_9FIRM|nr:1-(5-phosphoribosyl)-5-[(5-phosphoribosylamino)methylideneamino]imidazole-4-carboxamide isomerase [Anaerovorax odorimutans]MCQ4638405.1 1-(5-phosphoribosyl)-5-[(5-phosphoribosylamino)methylideneamino]imidazole-4-carboxamide isomerase [Anaerovorax odorimutans]